MECPKCRAEIDDGSAECAECGIIIEKFLKKRMQAGRAGPVGTAHTSQQKRGLFSPAIFILLAVVGAAYWFYLSGKAEKELDVKPIEVYEAKPLNEGTVEDFAEEKAKEKREVEEATKKINKLVNVVPGGGMKRKMAGE